MTKRSETGKPPQTLASSTQAGCASERRAREKMTTTTIEKLAWVVPAERGPVRSTRCPGNKSASRFHATYPNSIYIQLYNILSHNIEQKSSENKASV